MILKVLQQIFSNVRYVVIAVPIAFVVFAFAVWLPNWRLIVTLILSPSVDLLDKVGVIFSLFGSIGTNFTVISASYTVAIAILFGINIAMLIYYIRLRRGAFESRGITTGIGGLVSGIFGIGCASCGIFILSSVLALVGGAGIITFLPLGGEEFGILGVFLLGYATYWTVKKIEGSAVCGIET